MEKVPTVEIAASSPVTVTSTATEVGASEAAGSVPKWVIAAAIGVPVAAALAYILFGPSSDSEPKSTKKKKKKADIKESPKAEAEVDTKVKAKEQEEVGNNCQSLGLLAINIVCLGCFNRRC